MRILILLAMLASSIFTSCDHIKQVVTPLDTNRDTIGISVDNQSATSFDVLLEFNSKQEVIRIDTPNGGAIHSLGIQLSSETPTHLEGLISWKRGQGSGGSKGFTIEK